MQDVPKPLYPVCVANVGELKVQLSCISKKNLRSTKDDKFLQGTKQSAEILGGSKRPGKPFSNHDCSIKLDLTIFSMSIKRGEISQKSLDYQAKFDSFRSIQIYPR